MQAAPLGTHHGRKRYNPGSYCGTARGPSGDQLSPTQQDRRRHRRSGEHRAQSCEWSEKQTLLHFTSLPYSSHAPNRSHFLTY